MSLNQDEALQLIREHAEKVDNGRVYYCLRKMNFKPLWRKAVENMKVCVALHELKLPITVELFAVVIQANRQNALSMLHILGDKKALMLRRGEKMFNGNKLLWMLGPNFIQHYYGNGKEKKEEK